jgi:hypothetical protein
LRQVEFNLRWARLDDDERRLMLAWLRAKSARRTWFYTTGRPVVIGA